MLLPQKREREYRFKLALRMVLPIFALVAALISHTFFSIPEGLHNAFYIESTLILVFSIYFILYLIYKGFDTKITDDVSKVFTRKYIYKYLKQETQNTKEYTLLLISIDNLNKINNRYGMKNGDKILYEVTKWIVKYLEEKGIKNFPIGHVKGGDFLIGLKGNKDKYKTIIELMYLKSEELKIDDIEIQMSGAINDITLSKDINYLIENLFDLRNKNKNSKSIANLDDDMDPSDLESFVINAIKIENIIVMTQDIFQDDNNSIKECFIKLKIDEKKVIHKKKYMKILDKLRLMIDYDLLILKNIVEKCNDLQEEVFAISISPTSVRNSFFFRNVKELFDKNPNAKNRVIFLLDENEYYSRIDKYNSILQSLRDMGIIIAIDRLGAIHTSFLYLRDLDVDIVRFDSFYTKDINKEKYKNIISGFNVMAHEKGVKTWVKMVENEEIYNLSKELKIDYVQGKYLADLRVDN